MWLKRLRICIVIAAAIAGVAAEGRFCSWLGKFCMPRTQPKKKTKKKVKKKIVCFLNSFKMV